MDHDIDADKVLVTSPSAERQFGDDGGFQRYVSEQRGYPSMVPNTVPKIVKKDSDYPDARTAYDACIAWLLKMRVRHASQLSEFSYSYCFNTHKGTPDDPAYCPEPDVDWTTKLGVDHPPCMQKRGSMGTVADGCGKMHPWGYECPRE